MRQVSIKEFQANVYYHIKDLPIEITKRGDPLFWVVGEAPSIPTISDIQVPKFCQVSVMNPSVRCMQPPHGQYHVVYTGGKSSVSWDVWLCERHIKIQGDDVEVKEI